MAKKNKAASKNTAPKKKAEPIEIEIEDDEVEQPGNIAPAAKAKKSSGGDGGSVYKLIEVVGSSSESWEHAAQVAVERASKTLEDLRVAEVVDQDLKIEDGAIAAYRTRLRLSFKFRE